MYERTTCCNCSDVVSIRATGRQHGGSVSISVGLLCVSNGFIYFVSKPPQMRANQAFSDWLLGRTGAAAVPSSSSSPYLKFWDK